MITKTKTESTIENTSKELITQVNIQYKTYKSVDEQIEYLKTKKKIVVENEQKCALCERNYSSIINPYKEFFSKGRDGFGNHIYNNEINFKEILELIKFDDMLCEYLYSFIGIFEKKFKNILFNEICLKYVNPEKRKIDRNCIEYIAEIDNYLLTGIDADIPRFCKNIKYTIKKNQGYIQDLYAYEKRLTFLNKLRELGTGFQSCGIPSEEKKNKLIAHYISNQKIAPLWVLPNALSLGEFHALFLMLDKKSQSNIISSFYSLAPNKIDTNKINSFSGLVEIIRRIRNIINHYEPIYPFIYNEIKNIKKLENSQMRAAFDLLKTTYKTSAFTDLSDFDFKFNLEIHIQPCNFNHKHMRTLNFIINMLYFK